MILWAAGLGVTGLFVLYFVSRQRQYGRVGAAVAGTGFFVAAFYLDSIFFLIMASMGDLCRRQILGGMGEAVSGSDPEILPGSVSELTAFLPGLLGILGFLVSKSILAAVLLAAESVKREPEGDGWRYPDVLALAVNLFFAVLALACLYPGGSGRGAVTGVVPGSGGRDSERFAGALWLTFLLGVLLLYHASYYFYRKKMRVERLKSVEEAGRRRADQYLKNVEAQYQRTRELRHDLKNHIDLLSLLLREKKYEEMEDYLRIFGESVESLALPVRSGSLVVDALLADKAARARREQIRVELSLCDLRGLSLRPDEICSLLGNLLDNAIEAGSRAGEGRFLSVEWVERETDYFLRVRNSVPEEGCSGAAAKKGSAGRPGGLGAAEGNCAGRPGGSGVGEGPDSPETFRKRRAGDWAFLGEGAGTGSSKQDRRNQVGHGLGLRSVERTVHGCGGELAVESRAGLFTVAVRLPKQ